jgi:hypothetical protein
MVGLPTPLYADGSELSIGLHHWLKGNKCYKSEDWNCAVASWIIALSSSDFIQWNRIDRTLDGLGGLTQATVFASSNCKDANGITSIISTKEVVYKATNTLLKFNRVNVLPLTLSSVFTPSLDMCNALVCELSNDKECVEEKLNLLDAGRLDDGSYLQFLPFELKSSNSVSELIKRRREKQ